MIGEYPLMNQSEIDASLTQAEKAYKHWSSITYNERAEMLNKAAAILRRDKQRLGILITSEMGKVIAEAVGEVEKCAWVCEYYAEHAASFLQDEPIEAGYHKSFISYQPIGAVLAIMPWNFPFWQVFRFAAPTLMAGNVGLLKHARNVTGCALAIEKIFTEAGAPIGVFKTLIVDNLPIERIIAADIVQAVTLTGSEAAGMSVASLAGKYIKKSLLELGGSDALIVLADADIEKAAKVAIQSRMQNAGQSCIASKRFLVVKEAYNDFVHQLHIQTQLLKQGDPFNDDITTGPMARPDLAVELTEQMNRSIASGAVLDIGGSSFGCNFMPSILLNVKPGMATFEEEVFGPLASVIAVTDESEAIALANSSRFGLGGSIWSKDIEKAVAIARKITSGAVFINSLVKSDPRIPFGGIRKSGYGRELGRQGILEFVNTKVITVDL
jgi:succinate-semialdehyde dehydrogenase/glutarate-semialdehyde dehydrogenase